MGWRGQKVWVAGLACVIALGACSSARNARPEFNKANDPEAIRKLMTPAAGAAAQEGIALEILLDTSGSMKDPVPGAGGRPAPKIQIAQQALLNLVGQLAAFARSHPDRKILVGISDFSSRAGQPECREVVKIGAPDVAAAQRAVSNLTTEGTTPIGDAMIVAQRELAGAGVSQRHILVITDGENTVGYLPGDVASVIAGEPAAERSAIYFIAFDVAAEVFDPVKNAGGLVLAAGSEKQLTGAIDYILSGKVLVQPEGTPYPPHPVFSGRK